MASDVPTFGAPKVNPNWKIGIVRALWHDDLSKSLAESAINKLVESGVKRQNIHEITVPGSFEVPLFCSIAINDLECDGVIAIGIVIQGETAHAEIVAHEAARGCMLVALETGCPVAFEVVHAKSRADAEARSLGKGSKGPLAATTLLVSLARKAELQR